MKPGQPWAATSVKYGVGFFIIGALWLLSGRVLGFAKVEFVQDHHLAISVLLMSLGATLFGMGSKNL